MEDSVPRDCAEGALFDKANAANREMQKQIEKASGAAELRALCTKLRSRVLMLEKHNAGIGRNVSYLKSEIQILRNSRQQLITSLKVLAFHAGAGTVEARATEIAEHHDLSRMPW